MTERTPARFFKAEPVDLPPATACEVTRIRQQLTEPLLEESGAKVAANSIGETGKHFISLINWRTL